ncbi:hypothetical protein N8865_02030 [Francisellaceae bacterium]|nr:hypothetical protein [Francisellaceae bacterium]
MRGVVLTYDHKEKKGIISGDDGNRHHFTSHDLADAGTPEKNDKVDFEVNEGKIESIFVLQGNSLEKITSSVPAIIYCIYILSCIFPFAAIVGVVMAYVGRGKVGISSKDKDAFTKQIKQFWIMFILSIVGFLMLVIMIGSFLLIGVYIWWLIASIVGLVRHIN